MDKALALELLVMDAEVSTEGSHCLLRASGAQPRTGENGQNLVSDDTATIIFNDPTSLAFFVKSLSSTAASHMLTISWVDGMQSELSLSQVKTLQFGLLRSVTSETELTPQEKHGGFRGTFTKRLADDWRSSFRLLNDCWHFEDFCVSNIILDYSNSRNMEAREIVRLVQLVTTVMEVRSAKAGKMVSYSMQGYQQQNRNVLRGALPKTRGANADA